MKKSAFKRARRGYTLTEVTIAVVSGSVLLTGVIYATNEFGKAGRALYNEALVQTVAREQQNTLESNLPTRLSAITSTSGAQLQLSLQNLAAGDMTVNLSNALWLRAQDGAVGSADPGARLYWSADGATWSDTISLGARGMLDQSMVGYGQWSIAAENNPPADHLFIKLDDRVKAALLRVTSRMQKADMVPLYLQDVWGPRAVKWSWLTGSVPPAGGTDTDSDGLTDREDPYPWDPGRNSNHMGGLVPIALHETSLVGASPGSTLNNIFNGGGPGNFGWLSWNGDGSTPALAQMITDPGSFTFVNPRDPNDHVHNVGDWVHGNSGVSNSGSVRSALDALMGTDVTVLVWNKAVYSGSNLEYNTTGFARVRLTDYALGGHAWISATFLGMSDRDGNLIPATADMPTPAPAVTPTAAPVGSPAPSLPPSAAPSASPSPSPTPDPSAAPSLPPSAAPSSAPSESPSPSPALPSPSPTPNTDHLRPLAFHDSLFAAAANNQAFTVNRGTGATQFMWATWTNSTTETTLEASLRSPDSGTYTNPIDMADHHIDEADYLVTLADLSNGNSSKTLKSTLDQLKAAGSDLIVPTFDATNAYGQVRVKRYALVEIVGYSLSGTDQLQIRFLRFCNSEGI